MAAVEAALEKKAYDLVVLQTAASGLDRRLLSDRDRPLRRAGPGDRARNRGADVPRSEPRAVDRRASITAHWIVLDFDDVVAHIFFEPVREFYRLETNWTDARVVPLPEPLRSQADEPQAARDRLTESQAARQGEKNFASCSEACSASCRPSSIRWST